MNRLNLVTDYGNMIDGQSTLSAAAWNDIMAKIQDTVNELVEAVENGASAIKNDFYVNGVKTNPVNGVITLEPNTTYDLSGTLNGCVVIDVTSIPSADTHVNLNGVTIVSKENYAIKYNVPDSITKGKNFVVNLGADTINHLVCPNAKPTGDKDDAALFSTRDMFVSGFGYLSVLNNGGHGFRAGTMTINGPRIYVDCNHDAFHAGTKLIITEISLAVKNCNDIYGTGDKGTVIICDNAVKYTRIGSVNQDEIDVKGGTSYIIGDPETKNKFPEGHVYNHMYYLEDDVDKPGSKKIKCDFTTSSRMGEITKDENGCYIANSAGVEVVGYVEGQIKFTSEVMNKVALGTCENVNAAFLNIPVKTNCTVMLNNAYLYCNKQSDTESCSAIVYNAPAGSGSGFDGKGKVKLKASSTTVNAIICESDSQVFDNDAINSENNVGAEAKKESFIYVTSKHGNGFSGDEFKFTDSKGNIVIKGCAKSGVRAKAICIGPDADISDGVFTFPVNDGQQDTMAGVFVATGNCTQGGPQAGTYADHDNAKADIYAMNSSYNEGNIQTVAWSIPGCVLVGSMAAVNTIKLDDTKSWYYETVLTNNATNAPSKAKNEYVAIPYEGTPIAKA